MFFEFRALLDIPWEIVTLDVEKRGARNMERLVWWVMNFAKTEFSRVGCQVAHCHIHKEKKIARSTFFFSSQERETIKVKSRTSPPMTYQMPASAPDFSTTTPSASYLAER